MTKEISKITLRRRPDYGWYSREEYYNPDDELLILEEYFTSCVRYDPSHFSTIKKLMLQGVVGCNVIGATLIDGKFQFFHEIIESLKEPHISPEELLELIEKWYELVSIQTDKIVMTNNNGKFSIGTE